MNRPSICLWVLIAAFGIASVSAAEPGQVDPPLPDGTREAQAKIAALRMPKGLKVELFAAEPRLASPVALCLDEQGRVYVAEEFRFNRGTEENRSRPFLLEDDLQLKTVDDRLAMFQKFAGKFEGGMEWFTRYTDQVRRLEDRDGDGRAEISTVFAAGLNGPLDGLAAGLIARDGDIYLTCIPKLWKLRDEDGDGVAEKREALLHGFGVNAAFLGHDLHGLCWGPDGKLYFSVGDRGFHVQTKEGTTLAEPRRGAVFRCNADGSEFEVVHRGLRNPQELAFDDSGNLFAADNNCDKGDISRLVYVVEGADSGWNMAYQTIPAPYETGPWHAEKIWHLDGAAEAESIRPAWVLPPVGKLGAGPSGFAYCGAAGWSEHFRGRFFHCNYTGNGGIETFRVKAKGASFEIVGYEDFLKPISATDADFGYDGKLYVSDFVGLDWTGKSRGGRVYTAFDPATVSSAETLQVKELFAKGFKQRANDELLALLAHADQRVRQRAQFELAGRGAAAIPVFTKVAESNPSLLARLHAIWGLGMLGRHQPAALQPVIALLASDNAEIRAQAARTLGDVRCPDAGTKLVQLLQDAEPRVQLHAAVALGRTRFKPAVEPLFTLIQSNQNRDKYLRHACVYALGEIGNKQAVLAKANDTEPAVRLATLLVLRRWNDVEVKRFLSDADWSIAAEAARAVNDLALDAAIGDLAALADGLHLSAAQVPDSLGRRVIHANFRLGTTSHAAAVARIAANDKLSLPIRREALAALSDWTKPTQRDRVNGNWRPLGARDAAIVQAAVQPQLSALLSHCQGELQVQLTQLITKLALKTDDNTFVEWARDSAKETPVRIAALELLASRKHERTKDLLVAALAEPDQSLAVAAMRIVGRNLPGEALEIISTSLKSPETAIPVKQQALASLAELKTKGADELLGDWAARLTRGTVPKSLQLDVVEAINGRDSAELKKSLEPFTKRQETGDSLERFRLALEGGDVEKGKQIFTGHRQAQCSRCHRVGDQGGDAGPNLTRLSATAERQHLLASLVLPNLQIAPGFGSVTLLLADGTSVGGIIKSEKDGVIELLTPQNELRKIKTEEVEDRTMPVSAMPPMDKVLSLREIRDVVEFLSTLK
ncbi:Cytochrome c [Anatilimnocola aggregata]|uniref:Cytochrome c n=1 Tax=Anatilimnocola aggregata TaxID=2528021 RepID=A0A517YHP7_9BACT|nr:PVC-type heme-binding CxxCH protein [Anatilimnocola aggregata]QDU29732.1 Cytochrome c [Anatilimnocola aggregata]